MARSFPTLESANYMKILCMSDTHNYFPNLEIYGKDIDAIVHCGDFTESGTAQETYNFLNWFGQLNAPYKIFIGGNHDFFLRRK